MEKPAARSIRHLRWWIIALVMVGTAVNYLARSALGSAAPTLTIDARAKTRLETRSIARDRQGERCARRHRLRRRRRATARCSG